MGATEDFIRLRLLLAQTEAQYDFTTACDRVLEIYWDVTSISELATKTEGYAWMAASLDKIDPDQQLEEKEGLHTIVKEELQENAQQLLLSTADHHHAFHRIISALAQTKPMIAISFAQSLNTLYRRDLALLEFIGRAVELSVDKIDFSAIQLAFSNIVNGDFRDEALLIVNKSFSKASDKLDMTVVSKTLPLIQGIKNIQNAYKQSMACCFACNFLIKQDASTYSGLLSHLQQQLENSWNAIDIGWYRIDAGFKITKFFAESSPDLAREYLSQTDKIRDEIIMDAEDPALAYVQCLRLAIRAYSGLLPKNVYTEEDMERLTILIDRIPSKGVRAELWGELALRCFISDHIDKGAKHCCESCKAIIT